MLCKCWASVADGGPTLLLSKRWVTLDHCGNNYAALFVECRLYIYVIMQQSSIKRDNMSLKKVVDD